VPGFILAGVYKNGQWWLGARADNGNRSATPRLSPGLLAWQQLALCLDRLLWGEERRGEREREGFQDCKCNRKGLA
jgi:hypothetical protein